MIREWKKNSTTTLPGLLPLFFILAMATIHITGKQVLAADQNDAHFLSLRRTMVYEQIIQRGIEDRNVIQAMMHVPRHHFVPKRYISSAYNDTPLPIGHGQTISQPYIVAYMTEVLNLKKENTVLEVGTGSGYQAAILSPLVNKVYTIEIIPELARVAATHLKKPGYNNIECATGDGYYGWADRAPFDAIIVTAAAGHIPPPLLKQLKNGGRLVIPVGGAFMVQNLVLVVKDNEGKITTQNLLPVRFVPLTGKHD
ncbi:MAG: protein-L-isoaspartate(D-aspartate) O-methyltransferase [Syntrophales bacterium]|nr:protein-L-isoaspartate(D-aspartate) O-methyltransferase [Syntrophales bacterium]